MEGKGAERDIQIFQETGFALAKMRKYLVRDFKFKKEMEEKIEDLENRYAILHSELKSIKLKMKVSN